ncbi:CLUMA_CG000350, isoform A [Clunio marinus]|uniref:CLUMA_CG000350, isoform A n=1 Tax=Clunio marinus TaxID=568069 RepID=A0A1J1HJ42_9DIPT|nr:CLUMA_CG000350, isoform A [Clunio marinus]
MNLYSSHCLKLLEYFYFHFSSLPEAYDLSIKAQKNVKQQARERTQKLLLLAQIMPSTFTFRNLDAQQLFFLSQYFTEICIYDPNDIILHSFFAINFLSTAHKRKKEKVKKENKILQPT